ncbi:uncharacterized protein LOC141901335 isoform X2 [Tubulanus polymorphus]|uniref:uncharacterized protein LOC141901335 isoform X2 n=1 Tax=Tubulanus polymorphus TaxID=672921 RepID=UPI003DA3CA35
MMDSSPYFMPTNYMKPEPQDFYPCDTQPLGTCNPAVPSILAPDIGQTDKPNRKRGRKKPTIDNGIVPDTKVPKIKQEKVTNTLPVRKKRDRFNGMPEDEVARRILPDHLKPGLDIVIVGINPGLMAAYVGHHYAGPGNHFWKCLYLSGLILEPMTAYDDYKLLDYGIGFTNIVARTTRGSADLTRKEIKEGAEILQEKIKTYQPKIAVFNGKGIYEVFCGHKNFYIGKQPEKLPGTNTVVYVMPSSSARCSQLPRAIDKVPFYASLKKLRDHLRGDLPDLDDSEVCFPDLELKVKVKTEKTEPADQQQQAASMNPQIVPYIKSEPNFDQSPYGMIPQNQMQPFPPPGGAQCWNGSSSSAFNMPSTTGLFNNGSSHGYNNSATGSAVRIKQEIPDPGYPQFSSNPASFTSNNTDSNTPASSNFNNQHSPTLNGHSPSNNSNMTSAAFNGRQKTSPKTSHNPTTYNGNSSKHQSTAVSSSAASSSSVSSLSSSPSPKSPKTTTTNSTVVPSTTTSPVMIKAEPGTFSQGCSGNFNKPDSSISAASFPPHFIPSQYQCGIPGYPSPYGQFPSFPAQSYMGQMYPPGGLGVQGQQFATSSQSFLSSNPTQAGFSRFPTYPGYPQGPPM